jgi:hypothetical protein
MKIERRGYERNKGYTLLVESDVCGIDKDSYFHPKWNAAANRLCFTIDGVKGVPRNTTYEYHIEFSASELARLIDLALTSASGEISIHAQAKSIAAFIQEALHKKHRKAKVA